ncbi:MAG: DUF2934 domain-containing protein [Acidobacteriota bacterium]|nr:DUF2934 domain-containing protein [Acidobacteriota bacterium]
MIDPKFNELDETETGKKPLNTGLSQDTAASAKPRPGLSINDTIAADANLSVGSRGTDTSGVRAGAGAGAGSTFVTPGSAGESPAPSVVPGPRGSGITTLSSADPEQIPTQGGQSYSVTPASSISSQETSGSSEESYEPSNDEIAAHAYHCWLERGSPATGSSQEDWHRAERELRERARARRPKTSSAGA